MSSEPAGGAARPARPAKGAALAAVLAIVVLVPAIVAAIAIVRPQWYPTGDMAQAELHVRGFWSHPPLVGAAGRIQNAAGVQGSHPGPLLWLAMWPIYALGGSTSTALVVSVVIVHVATAVLALWLALRRGGVTFCLILAVVLALIVHAGGPEQFTEPWNPWMGLLPFLVLILAAWSVLDGEHWAIVLAVAAGTYSVQAHTGYVLVVGVLLTVLGVTLIVRAWRRPAAEPVAPRSRRWSSTLGWLGVGLLTAFVLWIPPLIDQLRRTPGNLSILKDSFTHPDAPYLGAGKVAEVTVVQLNVLGPWLLGPGRDGIDAVAIIGFIAFLALWAVGVLTAWRRRASSELHLHAVLGVAALLAIVSISRIFGVYLEYTVRWVWFITGTVIAASIFSLVRAHPLPDRWRRPAGAGALAVAAVALVVASVQFVDRAGPTGAIDSRIVAGLTPQVEAQLDRQTPYLVRWSDPSTLGATGIGLVLELERRGYHVGVDPQFAAAALPHRAAGGLGRRGALRRRRRGCDRPRQDAPRRRRARGVRRPLAGPAGAERRAAGPSRAGARRCRARRPDPPPRRRQRPGDPVVRQPAAARRGRRPAPGVRDAAAADGRVPRPSVRARPAARLTAASGSAVRHAAQGVGDDAVGLQLGDLVGAQPGDRRRGSRGCGRRSTGRGW